MPGKKLADRDIGDAPFLAVLIDSEGRRDRQPRPGGLRFPRRSQALGASRPCPPGGRLRIRNSCPRNQRSHRRGVAGPPSGLLTLVARAILEAFSIFASIIVGLATGAADALARVPPWAWAVLGVVAAAVALAAILNEDFREWLLSGLASIGEVLLEAARAIIGAAVALIRAVHAFFVWLWELIRPVVLATGKFVLVGAGVLDRLVSLLIDECTRAVDTASV